MLTVNFHYNAPKSIECTERSLTKWDAYGKIQARIWFAENIVWLHFRRVSLGIPSTQTILRLQRIPKRDTLRRDKNMFNEKCKQHFEAWSHLTYRFGESLRSITSISDMIFGWSINFITAISLFTALSIDPLDAKWVFAIILIATFWPVSLWIPSLTRPVFKGQYNATSLSTDWNNCIPEDPFPRVWPSQ